MSKRKRTQNTLESDTNPLGFMSGNQATKDSGGPDADQTREMSQEDSSSEKKPPSRDAEQPSDRIRRTYSVARRTDERLEQLQERLINILFHKVGPTAVKDVSKSAVLDTAVAFFNEYAEHEEVEEFVANQFNRHA